MGRNVQLVCGKKTRVSKNLSLDKSTREFFEHTSWALQTFRKSLAYEWKSPSGEQ